jgi:hypothetical protein
MGSASAHWLRVRLDDVWEGLSGFQRNGLDRELRPLVAEIYRQPESALQRNSPCSFEEHLNFPAVAPTPRLREILQRKSRAAPRCLRPEVILTFESWIRIRRIFRSNANPGSEVGLRNIGSRCRLSNRAADRVGFALDALTLHEEL